MGVVTSLQREQSMRHTTIRTHTLTVRLMGADAYAAGDVTTAMTVDTINVHIKILVWEITRGEIPV